MIGGWNLNDWLVVAGAVVCAIGALVPIFGISEFAAVAVPLGGRLVVIGAWREHP